MTGIGGCGRFLLHNIMTGLLGVGLYEVGATCVGN